MTARRAGAALRPPARGGALVVVPEFGPFDALVDPAFASYLRGDADLALRQVEEGLALSELAGDGTTSGYLHYVAAVVLLESGEAREALARAARMAASAAGHDDPRVRAKALALQANAAFDLRETGRGMDLLAEARHLLGRHRRDDYTQVSASFSVALALQAGGMYATAERLLASMRGSVAAVDAIVDEGLSTLQMVWAGVEELSGRPGRAAAHHRAALSHTLRAGAAVREHGLDSMLPKLAVREAHALQRLGLHDGALLALGRGGLGEAPREAEDLLDLEPDWLALVRGAAAERRGDLAGARSYRVRAVEAAEQRGRWLVADLARTALAELEGLEHGDHPGAERWRELAHRHRCRTTDEAADLSHELDSRTAVWEVRDLSERLGAETRQDPLTGLANRRALTDRSRELRGATSALFVDVDRFKAVNDDFSHDVGDRVLQVVAGLLARCCRSSDLVSRYGGDEFVVLTDADAEDALDVGRRVRRAVLDHDWGSVAPGLAVSVSIGVASGDGAVAALAAADDRLRGAKAGGRDRVAG